MYHLHTLLLLTKSDFKTVILPQMTFAFSSFVSKGFTSQPEVWRRATLDASIALLKAFIWTWTMLLLENMANQRLPGSILEDSKNKPWRPFPSRRLSPKDSQLYMLVLISMNYTIGCYLGAPRETTTLMALIWMYNDLDGANASIWWRYGTKMPACSWEYIS